MSTGFSDDLSDPTPSPPPARSSTTNATTSIRRASAAKAPVHRRTISAASATNRSIGMHTSATTGPSTTAHSRTASLANSLSMSHSAKGGTKHVNGHNPSDDDEDDEDAASQSGSELSSVPSEKGNQQQAKRPIITDEQNDKPETHEDDEGDDEENAEEDEEDDEEDEEENDVNSSSFVRPTPRHARTSSGSAIVGIQPRATRQSSLRSGSAAGGRTGRGVIPTGMWEWAKKKNYKKQKTSNNDDSDEEENEEDEENADEEDQYPAVTAPADEDEQMHTSPSPTILNLVIPTVKVEPPPSATLPTFAPNRASSRSLAEQDVDQDQDADPEPSGAPTPTPEPTLVLAPPPSHKSRGSRASGAKGNNGRSGNKRASRVPPPNKRAQREQREREAREAAAALRAEENDEEAAEELDGHPPDVDMVEHNAEDDEGEGEGDGDGDGENEGEYGNRQDALESLAGLELRFALVRQRIYQDKMDELGKEERFIREGSHPELLHTYVELDKRRERRVTLAELKRKRDVDLAATTRVNDEDSVWSWWMIQKDTVQSNLITDASRKRRRVERERRALLDPLRRTLDLVPPPEPPRSRSRDGEEDVVMNRPSPRDILSVALRHPYARLRSIENAQAAKNKADNKGTGTPTESMPALSQLAPAEIQNDLEVLLAYRRGFGEVGGMLTGIASGPGADLQGVNGPNPLLDGGLGTITVSSAVVPTPEAPFITPMGEIVHPQVAPEYARNLYELEQRGSQRSRDRKPPQAFNDHLAAHQYSNVAMPGAKGSSNGRDREQDRSKKYGSSAVPVTLNHGYPNNAMPPQQQQQQQQRDTQMHGGYPHSQHSHRQGQTMDPYASPGLGLQNMQRLPDSGDPRDQGRERDRDGMTGIQHMPLPPAPSTVGSGGNSKHHHHHHHPTSAGGAPGHVQGSQHPSLGWEGSRREREKEADAQRERSHSGAGRMGPGPSGYTQPPPPPPGSSSGTGRQHSHSVSSHPHQHTHYHPSHAHSRSSAQGSAAHAHSHSVLHTHSHSHTHPAPTSHLHVIHNHAPVPSANAGSGGNGSSGRRYEDPNAASNNSHRSRTSYPSGPSVDREKELRERERLAGAQPSMNVMHPSLSHGNGGQERERHAGYAVPHVGREPWADRERDRPKERDERRERDRERERERVHPMSMSSLSSHPSQQQQRSSRPESHAQGNYSQTQPSMTGSRYPYNGPQPYSPPSTQASQSRRSSPPPLLPPVPNTSRYSGTTHRRSSPGPPDPLNYNSSSQVQGETSAAHSPTSSLNPPGFNPWSAPPRSSGRAYRQPSPPPQKITPPMSSSHNTGGGGYTSSSSGGPLNPIPGPTLSPILPSAVSPAPRPSISPAPRPTSSASLHAILQPPSRENALTPQPVKRSGSGEGPMEVDPPIQQQQHTGFRHPSLAPLSHEGK